MRDKKHGSKISILPMTGLGLALIFLFCTTRLHAEPLTVKYPRAINGDIRANHARSFAELALRLTEKSHGDWSFQFTELDMERNRMEHELSLGERVNLLLLPGHADYDARFRRIDHQLDRGLTGKRILLIRRDRQHLFNLVNNLEDLQRFTFVSGSKWHITEIMDKAGLHVTKWASYKGMFSLLAAGRVDGFSRGVNEILPELNQVQMNFPDIVVEEKLLLETNLAFYLYTTRSQTELTHRLTDGLAVAKQQGLFDAVFKASFGKDLETLKLDSRKHIRLSKQK